MADAQTEPMSRSSTVEKQEFKQLRKRHRQDEEHLQTLISELDECTESITQMRLARAEAETLAAEKSHKSAKRRDCRGTSRIQSSLEADSKVPERTQHAETEKDG